MSNLAKKGSKPLLILVLLAVSAIAVGAGLVNYWSHQMTKSQIQYKLTGLDAYAIQVVTQNTDGVGAELHANYLAKTVASTFEPVTIYYSGGGSTSQEFSNAVILTYADSNLDLTRGLVISVTFDIGSPEVSASLSDAKWIAFYKTNSVTYGKLSPKTPPTIIDDTITILVADIDYITYETDLIGPPNTNANALVLEFTFTGATRPAIGEEIWDTYTADCLVTIEFSVDDGM